MWGRHEVTVLLWRQKHTSSVLEGKEHQTATKTEYLLTRSISAAILSPSPPWQRRRSTEQDVECVKSQTGQSPSSALLNNILPILWECVAALQTVQIWPLISNCLRNNAGLFSEYADLCIAIQRVSLEHKLQVHTHRGTHNHHGWLLSQCVRLLVDEIMGVPLISSPWFSSSASRSMDTSPLAVTARHGRDSEQTGRMLTAVSLKHVNTHTHTHNETHLNGSEKNKRILRNSK